MEPNKKPAEDWYKWYLRNPIGVADPEKKWIAQEDSLAFGAGLTLGTIMDDGFSIHAKTMLLLVFPGPIIMLEGQAAFLRKRAAGTGPSKSPAGMLHALAVLDGRAGDFRLNLDAKYQLPEKSGTILDLSLGAEAYFDFRRPDRWHLYLGQKPVPKRIRARIVKLLQANAYFMLESKGIRFGAWSGYDANWRMGPVALVLQAWIAGEAAISWEPVHLSGTLWLHGAFKLTIFGFGFGISADAKVGAQTPTPYHIWDFAGAQDRLTVAVAGHRSEGEARVERAESLAHTKSAPRDRHRPRDSDGYLAIAEKCQQRRSGCPPGCAPADHL